MVTMARLVVLAFVTVLPASGCVFDLFDHEDPPKRDGAECDHDEGCKSGACRGGMCTASSCNVTSNCAGGFTCEMAPTWVEVLSLGLAKGVCLPDCNTCPLEHERWSCAGTVCGYDADPHLTIGGPYEGIVGDPIALAVTFELDDGRELGTIEWSWNGMIVSTEATAEIVPDAPGTFWANVTVTDDASGYASAAVELRVCAEQGGACGYTDDCCAELSCSADGVCG